MHDCPKEIAKNDAVAWDLRDLGPTAGRSMRRILALFVLILPPTLVQADSVSYVGTLTGSTDVVVETFTLSSPTTIGLQTYGFGGGTNAEGDSISAGGTDPFLAIFFGTGPSATILTDGMGNPYGTSLDLLNYGNPDFVGCPPAGAPVIGGLPQCGDITMTLPSLAAGTYTVVLSDGEYQANAVFDDGTLGEGFSDFTGGGFCNVVINGVACPDPLGGAYAFDITGLPGGAAVPEPVFGGTLLCSVLLALGVMTSSLRRRRCPDISDIDMPGSLGPETHQP